MKSLILFLSLLFLTVLTSFAQTGRLVKGIVIDSTKLTLPGTNVKLVSSTGDSSMTSVDINGAFSFPSVKGDKITLTFTSIGYTSLRKHFTLDATDTPIDLGNIILAKESHALGVVTINGVVPVTLKEDTVQYSAAAYKVRDNAPAEDLLKKLPGVDVDVNGNVSTQGKQVTKVRINGKDFMGGDLQAATKSLPADVIENIQMIDDYGDQANLTGVKTGEPDKILNITIRKDKNYGYSAQGMIGDGRDALPAGEGADKNRYIGSVSIYNFNNDQQIAVLGSINNTNVNTLSFQGGGGGGRGGGGGVSRDGTTKANSGGVNFRDQWGKTLQVYGNYGFSDNTNSTNNLSSTIYNHPISSTQRDSTNNINQSINHRVSWNMEWRPDTLNYIKITPSFSYSGTNNSSNGGSFKTLLDSITSKIDTTSKNALSSTSDSQSPSFGINALLNHRFRNRSNLSLYVSANANQLWQYQDISNVYSTGQPIGVPQHQIININNHTASYYANLSYLQPIGTLSYLEFNYSLNHSITKTDKDVDMLSLVSYIHSNELSNSYNYTFTTNRFGLNYRFIQKNYNYTLGIAVQPSVLDGQSLTTDANTHRTEFNFIPTARYTYNFSRSKSFNINYNGSSSAPSFNQLQPIRDYSDPNNPVDGNPNLKQSFTNNVSIRYNNFSFESGDVFFSNISYQTIQNQVVTNTIFDNSGNRLQQWLNANGYYNLSGRLTYSKPWANRKYTLSFNGSATYSNNVGYSTTLAAGDSIATVSQSKIDALTKSVVAKNLALTPEVRFRVDIANVIDAQLSTNYTINKTNNSISNSSSNTRTWNTGLNGKNYFGDWTFSYDYSRAVNYGFNGIKVTNPNVLNVYLERMFLKNKVATLRLAAYDLFNQNTGYSVNQTNTFNQTSSVNRLSRYFLLTFTLRLKKFAGKAPTADPSLDGGPRGRRDGGGRGGDGGGRGGRGGGGFGGGGGF